MKTERRDFLKIASVGATGLVLTRGARAFAAWPASGTLEINPAISNLRVVAMLDKAMIPTIPSTMTLAAQSAALDVARVNANMDAMAMALAQKCTPDEAWKTIFRSGRPWASTVVAIKVNAAESKNTARIAVVDKLARVLTGFGVPAANIIIYDRGASTLYSSFCSKTDASKIPAVVDSGTMGGLTDVPLPDGTTAPCAKKIADGTVDILINIPTNKGHSAFGGATLSCKNHFGTFEPNHFCPPNDPAGNFCSNPDTTKFYNYVFTTNKSDAIIGGNPPRQQLVVVDSLFANKAENTGTPEAMPCYLVMGTFGPAVDFLTIKKIREEVMGAKHTASLVSQYMTQYGYTTNDPQWIVVPPGGPDAGTCESGGTGGTSGTGGAGTGGAKATGGAAGGDGKGTGGVTASSGNGGRTGGGGRTGTGGAKGTGGSGSGGMIASGGSGGSGGGLGGTSASSTPPGSGGSGGTVGSGGAKSDPGNDGSSGCGCRVGGDRNGAAGLGVTALLGTLAAGQLRRLFLRREAAAQADAGEATTSSSDDSAKPDR